MAIILTKKSDTASSVPLVADLTNAAGGAELAVNTADKRLFTKTSGGSVVELGTNPSSMTLPNGTANGIPYLNASKVLTSGSALTFDGTTSLAVRQNTGGTGNYSEVALDITNSFSGSGKSYLRNISLNGGNSSTALAFGVNADGGGAPSEQMRLTSTGLGIGTSSPQTYLHIRSTSGLTPQVMLGGTSSYRLDVGYNNSAEYGFLQAYAANTSTYDDIVLNPLGGNLGLGVTPSAWLSTRKAIDIGGSVSSISGAATTIFYNNAYTNASAADIYKTTGSAAQALVLPSTGGFAFYTAPSGTAGNAITFTQAMTLDASGSLLIAKTATGGVTLQVQGNSTNGTYLQLDQAGVANRRFGIPAGSDAFVWTGFTGGTYAEQMRLDASGNLLVGTTSSSAPTGGFAVVPNSNASFINIGHVSGTATGSVYEQFWYNSSIIGSITQNGTTAVAYNTTSDHRLKNNVRTADALRFKDIRFVDFEWVDGRHDCGVIAHELQAIYPDLVVGTKDETEVRTIELTPAIPAVLDEEGNVVTPEVPAVTEEQTFDKHQQVNYIGLIPRMGTVIQQLMAKVEAMEAEIAALKAAP